MLKVSAHCFGYIHCSSAANSADSADSVLSTNQLHHMRSRHALVTPCDWHTSHFRKGKDSLHSTCHLVLPAAVQSHVWLVPYLAVLVVYSWQITSTCTSVLLLCRGHQLPVNPTNCQLTPAQQGSHTCTAAVTTSRQ